MLASRGLLVSRLRRPKGLFGSAKFKALAEAGGGNTGPALVNDDPRAAMLHYHIMKLRQDA